MSAVGGFELRAWQQEAFDRWVAAGRRGVVEAVTGTGKTAVGITAAADAVDRGRTVLVVVPGVALLEQWYQAIRRAVPNARVGRRGAGVTDSFAGVDILVSTVQSAIGSGAPMPDGPALLVADEVHRYGASSFSRLLSDAFDERIGLTATFERNDNGIQEHLLPYFETLIPGCDYPRGHTDGILAPVRVMLVSVPFTPEEQFEYNELDETVTKERLALTRKYGCREEPFGEFMRDVMILSEGGADRATWSARRYLKAFSRRRAILAESQGKLDTLREIGSVLATGGRSIVFSETKESAKLAAEALLEQGVVAAPYTSDLSTGDRAELLGLFKEGIMTTLAAPRVLDEGVDVPEADVGIILASSRTRRQMIQRMGRIVRPKSDGRHASFLVLYIGESSEDPGRGAHGTFLEQLTTIASDLVDVDAGDAPGLLADWLSRAPQPAEQLATQPLADNDDVETVSETRSLLTVSVASSDLAVTDLLLSCLAVLEPGEIQVMLCRLGIGEGNRASIRQTSEMLDITESDVRAHEAAALARLEAADVAGALSDLSAMVMQAVGDEGLGESA
ncbi:Helicase C-terminal domain protein [Rhodococcus sp. RD6.2]|uniref:DEAD/DEAH box helicase n=1 Tax=Rhodococcus sp. RD6.2 TaxID=260936 RepID=UPI00063BB200|nr:DEAD/DEAH box helicase [Rhodococcus sp. RD6.2]CRK50444.1 Helicase C-terminal domain protein [Rhodococcus sp. RD6.2]